MSSGETKAAKTMAEAVEALAKRNYEREWVKGWNTCPDSARPGWIKEAQETLDFLSAAGFGLVADAKAAALEEAATECDQTSSNILNKNHALNPAWDGMAEGWKNAATRLRVHASVIRNQS